MLDSAEKLVGRDEARGRVFDGRQSSMEGRADVTHQHVCLIPILNPAQFHLASRLEPKKRIQLRRKHGFVKTGREIMRLLHSRELARAG